MNLTAKIITGLSAVAIVIAALYFSFFMSEEPPKDDSETDVIAVVGPNKIRTDQFMEEAGRRGGSHPEKLDKQALLNEMIDYEAVLVKAVQAGLDKDPEVMRMYRNILVGKYKQRHLTPQIESTVISEEDIVKNYEENLSLYTQAPKIRISMLYMAVHHTMSEEKKLSVREKMAEAREKALKLTDEPGFGALAIEYSEDQVSRYKGGDIGWISEGVRYRWDQTLPDAGFALQNIGDISDIIETENSVCLVRLTGRQDRIVTPLDKVRERIRHKMLLDKRKETEKLFTDQIRAAAEIRTYPEVLDKIRFAPAVPASGPPGIPLNNQ